ncbi:transporter substrate-binding domain-containing protein [Marinobacteraceae bacterium S3BR75-40.1]
MSENSVRCLKFAPAYPEAVWWCAVWILGLCLVPLDHARASEAEEQLQPLVLTTGHWPPYFDQQMPHAGIAAHIIELAAKRAGYAVEYRFYPWTRSLYMAEKGKVAGTAAWFANDQREQKFFISKSVIASGYVFFHRRKPGFDWGAVEDLAPYKIGTTIGYYYGDFFEQALKAGKLQVESVSSDRLNFQKLLAGRIDLFPNDRVVGLYLLKHELPAGEARNIVYHPRPLLRSSLHLLLSRRLPENKTTMARFNQALAELRDLGMIERILIQALGNQLGSEHRQSSAATTDEEY